LTLIQITPLKLDPIGHFVRFLGKNFNASINQEIEKRLKSIEGKLEDNERAITKVSERLDRARAISCRIRILQFADSILHGELHSKESFSQVLKDIKDYDEYCENHKEFENNMTVMATKRIKEVYEYALKDNEFI